MAEKKTHKRADLGREPRAMCGAKNPRLADLWASVTCGNCLSWRPHSERKAAEVRRD
ncbi:MAG TPA: hypothetical protein VFX59_29855 [Polyangiales bacterium]|nr:hypothetical protein [Polyangiales bacterium]